MSSYIAVDGRHLVVTCVIQKIQPNDNLSTKN